MHGYGMASRMECKNEATKITDESCSYRLRRPEKALPRDGNDRDEAKSIWQTC